LQKVAKLPLFWDWRNVSGVNYVRPVRDQGSCGSCYAFASTGVVASQILLRSNGSQKFDLSVNDIVGCSKLSQGCEGGFPYLTAGRYAEESGLIPEACNPYTGPGATCTKDRDSCRKFYTTDYEYVGGYYGACNEEEMLLALVSSGPLAVGFEVYEDFRSYESGVYQHSGFTNDFNPFEVTSHAVLLVGYGQTEDGTKYWIVQNSWGASWGMDGYFWIRRGVDEVGIESIALQATAWP